MIDFNTSILMMMMMITWWPDDLIINERRVCVCVCAYIIVVISIKNRMIKEDIPYHSNKLCEFIIIIITVIKLNIHKWGFFQQKKKLFQKFFFYRIVFHLLENRHKHTHTHTVYHHNTMMMEKNIWQNIYRIIQMPTNWLTFFFSQPFNQ